MNEIKIAVRLCPHFEGLALPAYQTDGAAGMDVAAAVTEDVVIPPGELRLIPTGLMIELPEGYEAQMRPRSGLAAKNSVTLLNSPGTIDADYRGEIRVILANLGREPFTVTRGMRIAQMVFAPVTRGVWSLQTELSGSARADGGFGHTGV